MPKTIKDLIDEQAQTGRHIPMEEFDRAREYQQSLIPKDLEIPVKGEKYITTQKLKVYIETKFAAACSGGYEKVLPENLELEVVFGGEFSDFGKPLSIACWPIKYKELEPKLVEKKDLKDKLYMNYYIDIETIKFKDCLKKIG